MIRAVVLLCTFVAFVGLLTGCGEPAPAGPVPSAGPSRFSSLADLSSATTAAQKAAKTAKFTILGGRTGTTQTGLKGEGALRYDDAGPSIQLTQRVQSNNAAPVDVTIVVLPDVAFVRLPPGYGPALPASKPWVRVRSGSTGRLAQQFAPPIQAVRDTADPATSFAQFGDAVAIVESAEEPLDGVPSARYKIRADLAKAAQNQTDPARRQAFAQSVRAGLTSIDYTMWLDAQNRMMRVLVDQRLPGNQGTFTFDARYRDWGQPVQITVPPPTQVAER